MIIGLALQPLFSGLITDINNIGLPMLSEVLYSPTLSFDPELRKYIVQEDEEFKTITGLNNWIGLIWSREVLKESQDIQKRFKSYTQTVGTSDGKKYNVRMAELNVTLVFVGTSLTQLEVLEEYLLARNNRISYSVTTSLTDVTVVVREFRLNSLSKEQITTHGSLATVGCEVVLAFPVIMYDSDVKLIQEINFNIYDWNGTELSTRIIVP